MPFSADVQEQLPQVYLIIILPYADIFILHLLFVMIKVNTNTAVVMMDVKTVTAGLIFWKALLRVGST
jgi:hypothetical protein